MNGAGNDFVILDAVEQPLGLAPEDVPGLVCRLCDRHMGIGADGGDLLMEVQMENGRVNGLFLTGAALFVCSGELAGEFLDPVSMEQITE